MCINISTQIVFSCLFRDIMVMILCFILVIFLPFYNFQDIYCLCEAQIAVFV